VVCLGAILQILVVSEIVAIGETATPLCSLGLSATSQPPVSSTFLSEQTSHQQPANSTLLSEQTSTSQPNKLVPGVRILRWKILADSFDVYARTFLDFTFTVSATRVA
jgi:hypothetical protein